MLAVLGQPNLKFRQKRDRHDSGSGGIDLPGFRQREFRKLIYHPLALRDTLIRQAELGQYCPAMILNRSANRSTIHA
jgi:hypothetical protein